MEKRYVSIWFKQLVADRMALRYPALRDQPFVVAIPAQGRMVITATNAHAVSLGISPGMVVADAKASVPGLHVLDDRPGLNDKLLETWGHWCIRYTPIVAVDPPNGLLLNATGCTHLWGDEQAYLHDLVFRLAQKGFEARAAMADTAGAAWAMARFGKDALIVPPGQQRDALAALPPAALRLEKETLERLHKLGFYTVGTFMSMPRTVLRRRFGEGLLWRLRQALGAEEDALVPIRPIAPYVERLPCLDPIRTAKGIEIALQHLLESLCHRLAQEGKGIRRAVLTYFRIDGKTGSIAMGTHRATATVSHLFKLFALKIVQIKPALGIELFELEAVQIEETDPAQETMWEKASGLEDPALAELLDRLAGRTNACTIRRYLPAARHWPERSLQPALRLSDKLPFPWPDARPRPTRLLAKPEPIEVSAPIPDYPPMLFRYRDEVHPIKKADGPERIAREWWMDAGEHRDYFVVEDDKGQRYWLFRSGHYQDGHPCRWFIHGFFA